MRFLFFIQDNKEILMSFLFFIISMIVGFLAKAINKTIKIVGAIILACGSLLVAFFLYFNSWKLLIVSILAIVAIIAIPLIPIIFNNGSVGRKKIGKLLYKATKKADVKKDICMFCGDLDFLGDYTPSSDADKKSTRNNIEKNKQFRQIKDCGYSIKIICLKPIREDNIKDKQSRIRLGYIKQELGNNSEIRFFNENECFSEDSCPYGLSKADCNQICYCPDLLLRGRLFHLKVGSICVILVTATESGKKYKIEEYKNNSKEAKLYENIWDICWKSAQEDKFFLDKCMLALQSIE